MKQKILTIVKKDFDEDAVKEYLNCGYVTGPLVNSHKKNKKEDNFGYQSIKRAVKNGNSLKF